MGQEDKTILKVVRLRGRRSTFIQSTGEVRFERRFMDSRTGERRLGGWGDGDSNRTWDICGIILSHFGNA